VLCVALPRDCLTACDQQELLMRRLMFGLPLCAVGRYAETIVANETIVVHARQAIQSCLSS
jgi:hypothetical protein